MIMGTFAEVSIYSNDEKTAGNAIEEALNEMERMDRIMSNYKNDSELSKVNKRLQNRLFHAMQNSLMLLSSHNITVN